MKKRKILSLWGACILATALVACGDGSDNTYKPIHVVGEPIEPTEESSAEQEQVVEETTVQVLEEKYAAGNFEEADYKTLARLYVEENRLLEARDTLEVCYSLNKDAESYAMLQELTVNAAEEEAMAQQLDLLIQNLNTPEYANESLSMLFSDEWFYAMMPRLSEGKRSYYRELNDTTLYVEVGYNELGQKYTSIWKQNADEVMIIQQTPNTLQQVVTGLKNNQYQGEFESWLCIAPTGDVFHEQGTFAQGAIVGEYKADVKWGKAPSDIMALWSMRETMDFTEYSGDFDGLGYTTLPQLQESNKGTLNGNTSDGNIVVYAYEKDYKSYLSMNIGTGLWENYQFTNASLGLADSPDYSVYNPVQEGINSGLISSDSIGAVPGEGEEPQEDLRVEEAYQGRGGGKIKGEFNPDATPTATPTAAPTATPRPTATPTAAPTATPKPTATPTAAPTATPKPTATPTPEPTATPKPTATPTPAPTATPKPTATPTAAPTATPKPTATPTPAPTATPKPTATPTPAPTATPTPAPTATPTPAPTNPPSGGDTDVEWSPDLD